MIRTALFGLITVLGSVLQAQSTYHVKQQHPGASDMNEGTPDQPLLTISQAAALAGPGDSILVYEGTYRERVAPPRGGNEGKPIVYMAVPGHEVMIKGSEVWEPDWVKQDGDLDIYHGKLASNLFVIEEPAQHDFDSFPRRFAPFEYKLNKAAGELDVTLGQVFVEGKPLIQVDNHMDLRQIKGSWMVDDDQTGLFVHFPYSYKTLSKSLVEITTRPRTFAPYKRGLGYIHVIGFIMEHGATNWPAGFWSETGAPQAGILGCRGGHHWLIENNTIRYGKTAGLDIGAEGPVDADSLGQPRSENAGYHVVRNNIITDNGSAGILGYRSTASKIIGNRIERNNRLGFQAPEMGGMKFHFFIDGEIRGNLVRNNYCYGIWLDNVWKGSRVTQNTIIGNHGTGMFIELGEGPLLVDNNVIALTQNTGPLTGDGIYCHDASGVTLAHNLIMLNANYGLWSHVATDRNTSQSENGETLRKPSRASNWRILNNLFIANHVGAMSLPAISDRSDNNVSDYNVFTGSFNRLTADTYSKELDAPLFLVNTNKGRVPIGSLYDKLERRLGNKSLDRKRWEKLPLLEMEDWVLLSGHDQNSVIPVFLRPNLTEDVLQLNFLIDDSLMTMRLPRIEGIQEDFYGNPLSDQPVPGPFQHLVVAEMKKSVDFEEKPGQGGPYGFKATKENSNNFWLWPVETSRLK